VWRRPQVVGLASCLTTPVNILLVWRQQYDRMRRSLTRLVNVSTGVEAASSEDATDVLLHFFEDAYHLRNWITSALPTKKADVEKAINDALTLSLCADLANGAKHFRLGPAARHPPRTGDVNTAIVSQSVTVRPAPVGSGRPAAAPLHSWSVSSGGEDYDAVELARQVVQAWDVWLGDQGLL